MPARRPHLHLLELARYAFVNSLVQVAPDHGLGQENKRVSL